MLIEERKTNHKISRKKKNNNFEKKSKNLTKIHFYPRDGFYYLKEKYFSIKEHLS